MTAEPIARAKQEATAARDRVDTTVGALQARLNPRARASEALDTVLDKTTTFADTAVDTARQRPTAVGVAAGAVALFVLRKPLGRLFGVMFRRKRKSHAFRERDALARANASMTPPDDLIPQADPPASARQE